MVSFSHTQAHKPRHIPKTQALWSFSQKKHFVLGQDLARLALGRGFQWPHMFTFVLSLSGVERQLKREGFTQQPDIDSGSIWNGCCLDSSLNY